MYFNPLKVLMPLALTLLDDRRREGRLRRGRPPVQDRDRHGAGLRHRAHHRVDGAPRRTSSSAPEATYSVSGLLHSGATYRRGRDRLRRAPARRCTGSSQRRRVRRPARAGAAASALGVTRRHQDGVIAQDAPLRCRVGGDDRAAGGRALEDLVRHDPARLLPGAEDPQAHVVLGDQRGQVGRTAPSPATGRARCAAAARGRGLGLSPGRARSSLPQCPRRRSSPAPRRCRRALQRGIKAVEDTLRVRHLGGCGRLRGVRARQRPARRQTTPRGANGTTTARPRCRSGRLARCSSVSTTITSAAPQRRGVDHPQQEPGAARRPGGGPCPVSLAQTSWSSTIAIRRRRISPRARTPAGPGERRSAPGNRRRPRRARASGQRARGQRRPAAGEPRRTAPGADPRLGQHRTRSAVSTGRAVRCTPRRRTRWSPGPRRSSRSAGAGRVIGAEQHDAHDVSQPSVKVGTGGVDPPRSARQLSHACSPPASPPPAATFGNGRHVYIWCDCAVCWPGP